MNILDLECPYNWTKNIENCFTEYNKMYQVEYLSHKNVPFQNGDPLSSSPDCPFTRRHKLIALEK